MGIKHVTAEELRHFIRSHHENDFVLVDVRQPEEYRRGHIPGARLVPVAELVHSPGRLPADKTLVFYCHGGGRSMAAAVMADEEAQGRAAILNLNGGMLAWDGARLDDVPQVRLFKGRPGAQMFATAIALEKGAQLFYETLADDLAGKPGGDVFAKLAQAESAHARAVYGFWQKNEPDLESFETLYERESGDILEGGMPLKQALRKAASRPADGLRPFIETALQIEYAAYDLYRAMADEDTAEAYRGAFLALAQAEKGHMRALIEALSG